MDLVIWYTIRLPEKRIIGHPQNKSKSDISKMVLGHYKIFENEKFVLKWYNFLNYLNKKWTQLADGDPMQSNGPCSVPRLRRNFHSSSHIFEILQHNNTTANTARPN